MKKILLGLVSTLLIGSAGFAQQVSGVVKNDEGKSVDKATVSLLNAKDSSVSKLSVTGKDGKFNLSTTKTGRFLISASYVGFRPVYSNVFELPGSGDVNIPELLLNKASGEFAKRIRDC